jgi:hypothetical protein
MSDLFFYNYTLKDIDAADRKTDITTQRFLKNTLKI